MSRRTPMKKATNEKRPDVLAVRLNQVRLERLRTCPMTAIFSSLTRSTRRRRIGRY